MDAYERTQLADSLRKESYADGAEVVVQGDPGDNFYIVEDGTAVCLKADNPGDPQKQVMELTSGQYFGELALLRDEPRAATVVAKTSLKVLSIDRKTFNRLLGPLAKIMEQK